MAKTNTEKPSGKDEQKKQNIVETSRKKADVPKAPLEKSKSEEKVEDKKSEEKKKEVKKVIPKVIKEEVTVKGVSVPISAKYSVAICKFIKGKKIEKAIADLEEVLSLKKAIPMKGEISHQKGKGMMSGKYPQSATKHFILLLKSLKANADNHEVEEPTIIEAMANVASRPYGRFGSIKRKRTHILIKAKQKKTKVKEKKK